MQREREISPFPADVWLTILLNLPASSIVRHSMLISKALCDVCRDDALWRAVLVRDNPGEKKIQQIADRYKGKRSFLDLYRSRYAVTKKYKDLVIYQPNDPDGSAYSVRLSFACPLRWEDLEDIDGTTRHCQCCSYNVRQLTSKSTAEDVQCVMGVAANAKSPPGEGVKVFLEGSGEVEIELDTHLFRMMGEIEEPAIPRPPLPKKQKKECSVS